jgi:hypothetical protein
MKAHSLKGPVRETSVGIIVKNTRRAGEDDEAPRDKLAVLLLIKRSVIFRHLG